jgi:uncharacterized membrane protein
MPAAPSEPPAQYTDTTQPFNTMAILAFVLVWPTAILGIVLGFIALSQIKRTHERGHGLALAAVIIGFVGIAIGIVAFIVFAAVAGWFIATNPGGVNGY